MTDTKGAHTMYTKPLAMTGTGILALALLTGCTTAEPEADNTPADNGGTAATTAPAQTSPAGSSPAAGDDEGTGTATPGDGQSTTGTAPTAGEDPVYAAIDAVHAAHPEAFIVQVDRDDDDTAYEIEAHEAGTIREFTVTTDGTVREDDGTEKDDDHVRRAREATVTAEQAAEAALEGRGGQSIDEMELDEEDGTLGWKVELDDDQGRNGDEVFVDAKTGEVRTR